MALDAISSAASYDAAKMMHKPLQDPGTINVIEAPAAVKSSNGSQSNQDQKQNSATDKQIKDAISRANSKIKTIHRTSAEFTYHEETKRIAIKLIDDDTKEVIKEIPPEETLEMIAKMWELAGLMVDEKR